jgi:hypothetical protein
LLVTIVIKGEKTVLVRGFTLFELIATNTALALLGGAGLVCEYNTPPSSQECPMEMATENEFSAIFATDSLTSSSDCYESPGSQQLMLSIPTPFRGASLRNGSCGQAFHGCHVDEVLGNVLVTK